MIIDDEIKHLKQLTSLLSTSPVIKANKRLQEKLQMLSKPPGEIKGLKLTDIIDLKLLQLLQDNFSDTYRISSVIYDEQGIPITYPSNFSKFCDLIRTSPIGLKRCEESKERSYEIASECDGISLNECKNFPELLDASIPFEVGGYCVGTWCAGQIVTEHISEDRVKSYAEEIDVDQDKLWEYSQLLPVETVKEYKKLIDFLDSMCKALCVLGLQNVHQAKEIYKRKLGEAKYKTLFNSSQDAIFLMDGDTYIDCNDSALTMFGCNREEMLNINPSELSPEFQPSGRRSDDEVQVKTTEALKGNPQRFYWRHKKCDETLFDVEASLNKVEIEGTGYHMAVFRRVKGVLCW